MIALRRILSIVNAAALILLLSGCAARVPSAGVVMVDGQLAFQTPEEAVKALKTAVDADNQAALLEIFGPQGKDLAHSGDPVADAADMKSFAKLLDQSTQVMWLKSFERPNQRLAALLVGPENWPFPIPLVERNGRWQFDTENGKQEIINRRIGENEMTVISLFREYANAQREYAAVDRNNDGVLEYAAKFISSPGKQDGLYWQTVPDQPLSPMGPLFAQASQEGYVMPQNNVPAPFHGYYFRILTAQGDDARGGRMNYAVNGKMIKGFALLAYPARWDESGVMTFQMGPDGVVYQKNLGGNTDQLASKIDKYDPDPSWVPTQVWK